MRATLRSRTSSRKNDHAMTDSLAAITIKHPRRPAEQLAAPLKLLKLREIQNKWWLELAERPHLHADLGNTEAFYEALHKAYGPFHHAQAPLR